MKLMHVSGPELPGGAAQRATLLSAGTSSLHAAGLLAVKPVQVTWLLAVFSTSSSVLSVPHGDSVTAGTQSLRGLVLMKGIVKFTPKMNINVLFFIQTQYCAHLFDFSTRITIK